VAFFVSRLGQSGDLDTRFAKVGEHDSRGVTCHIYYYAYKWSCYKQLLTRI
jgi:hypothetical protein